jgi:DUF1680 family protein
VYATRENTLYVNLFVAGSADISLDGGKVRIEQETAYPWDGHVAIKIAPELPGQKIALKVRVPGWAQGQAFPSNLYRFAEAAEAHTLAINGEPVVAAVRDGYATVDREWQPDDTVTLELPMPVRRILAHEKVEADRGRVALMRGPIVYCIEWPDVHRGQVKNLVLPDEKPLATEFRNDLLGGVQVITGAVHRIGEAFEAQKGGGSKRIPFTEEITFSAIPYYAWAHRGPGEMAVWLARTADALQKPEN